MCVCIGKSVLLRNAKKNQPSYSLSKRSDIGTHLKALVERNTMACISTCFETLTTLTTLTHAHPDGTVYSWGINTAGQLGHSYSLEPSAAGGGGGRRDKVPSPVRVRALDGQPVVHIATGRDHSFAVTISGAVFGWGRNRYDNNNYYYTTMRLLKHSGLVLVVLQSSVLQKCILRSSLSLSISLSLSLSFSLSLSVCVCVSRSAGQLGLGNSKTIGESNS